MAAIQFKSNVERVGHDARDRGSVGQMEENGTMSERSGSELGVIRCPV